MQCGALRVTHVNLYGHLPVWVVLGLGFGVDKQTVGGGYRMSG